MENINNDNHNYLIPIQTIEHKNISSSFNNLNSIISLDSLYNQNDSQKYAFSNFNKIKKKIIMNILNQTKFQYHYNKLY